MDYKSYFKDKKITIIGLGLLGRGIGDIKFMAQNEAILTVTDLKTEEELKSSIEQLKDFNITYSLGGHKMEDFQNCDLVVKAAGIPFDSPFIEEAKKNNIPVKMSTSLFAEMYSGTIIGVTGTRGKSTVVAMIHKILKDAGMETFLGGNVRGVSTLAHLPESSADEFAVLELDSWQLQGFGDEKISPHISVFTTFFPDHLNYYHNDLDLYMEDKAQIFLSQGAEDFLVLGDQVATTILSKYEDKINSKISIVKSGDWNLKIPGEHNKYNASLAAKVGEIVGIDQEKIKESLENFEAIEGRLQFLKEYKGVKIFNDNNATTPNATIAALESLKDFSGKIILIAGGSDKNLETDELLNSIQKFCKNLILLPGSGTDRLGIKNYEEGSKNKESKLIIPNSKFIIPGRKIDSIKEAVEYGLKYTEHGDVILFSPAFASFGPPPGGFKNEFDRNDQFVEVVEKLTK